MSKDISGTSNGHSEKLVETGNPEKCETKGVVDIIARAIGKKLHYYHHLTTDDWTAALWWEGVTRDIGSVGRKDILENPEVLDIGGGMGEFSKYLNKNGIHAISLDIQDLEVPPEANPVTANAAQMPFPDASFDIVYGHGVFDNNLYHQDYPKLFKEIARVLKQRGIFTFTYYYSPFRQEEELEKFFTCIKKPDGCASTRIIWEKK